MDQDVHVNVFQMTNWNSTICQTTTRSLFGVKIIILQFIIVICHFIQFHNHFKIILKQQATAIFIHIYT